MALPYVFANVTELDTPQIDANFNALGALTVIPCTSSGNTNIVLTPIANTPTISAYSNRAPIFAFVAAGNSGANVTINVSGVGAVNLYKQHGATQATTNDLLSGRVYYVAYDQSLNSGGGGFVLITDQTATAAPNIQSLSGSGTYTTPAGAAYLIARMCAGGAGGGARTSNPGNNGTDTSFESWTALHGVGGNNGNASSGNNAVGGAGGTGGATGTGTQIIRIAGNAGGSSSNTTANGAGGNGGAGPFGGAGVGAPSTLGTGGNAGANSGGGGGGAAGSAGAGSGGGGSGEYVEFMITSPAASYAYSVGTKGTGGAAGGAAGGDGANGFLVVMAYF